MLEKPTVTLPLIRKFLQENVMMVITVRRPEEHAQHPHDCVKSKGEPEMSLFYVDCKWNAPWFWWILCSVFRFKPPNLQKLSNP